MYDDNILKMSIYELQHVIKNKTCSPVEITKSILKEIDEKNKQINAFITVLHDSAIEKAIKAEEDVIKGNFKGPLHGVPISLKDIINLRTTKTTCGSLLNAENKPNYDAEVAKHLISNGAIIIGKENMHSLAYGSTGDISHYGPVKNPSDLNKISGGSSSGSAASVASNLSYGSIGSDTGGSIRIPAACCGIVGMKPTLGSISRKGTVSLAPSLDTLGPLTKNVYDNYLMFQTINQTSNNIKPKKQVINRNIIGIPKQFYFDIIDSSIEGHFYKVIQNLSLNGFKIKYIDIPYLKEFNTALSVIFAAEVYNSLEREIQQTPERIEPEIRNRILEGLFIQGHEYIDMFRVKALAKKKFTAALEEVDTIMTPTMCAQPGEIGAKEINLNGVKKNVRQVYSRLVKIPNLIGFPAITIPIKLSKYEASNSIQLIGLPLSEDKLYSFAYSIEQLHQ